MFWVTSRWETYSNDSPTPFAIVHATVDTEEEAKDLVNKLIAYESEKWDSGIASDDLDDEEYDLIKNNFFIVLADKKEAEKVMGIVDWIEDAIKEDLEYEDDPELFVKLNGILTPLKHDN